MTRFEKLRKQRRIVRVPVDMKLFADLIQEGVEGNITANGLPKDAIFLTVAQESHEQAFNFLFMHESFDKVKEGSIVPVLMVMLTRKTLARERLEAKYEAMRHIEKDMTNYGVSGADYVIGLYKEVLDEEAKNA